MSRKTTLLALVCAFVALASAQTAQATLTLRNLTYLKGQGESTIWSFGLVTGLNGTGDTELPTIGRQVARLLEEAGAPIPDFNELAGMQNVALVMVQCTIPREGAQKGDQFDVTVQTWHNATSLEGGTLFITPLRGPRTGAGGERYVYAYAQGEIVIENIDLPTAGRIYNGADITHDITMRTISADGRITLVVRPEYAGWTTTRMIADMINDEFLTIDDSRVEIARAINEREVRIDVPEPELVNPSGFLATVEEIAFDSSLLSLPAKVVVNSSSGAIAITGNVEISPAVISHGDLVITTVSPPREPTLDRPMVEQSSAAAIDTVSEEPNARLEDLVQAMRQLKVTPADQIAILKQLHRLGHLHAEFVVE